MLFWQSCSLHIRLTHGRFQTDLRLLFDLAGCKQSKDALDDYIHSHQELRELNPITYRMLAQYLDFDIEQGATTQDSEGGINMCKAIDDMREDARLAGLEQGRDEGGHNHLIRLIRKKLEKGKAPAQIALECEETEETICAILAKLQSAH